MFNSTYHHSQINDEHHLVIVGSMNSNFEIDRMFT
jgi:hypothetical protein